MGLRALRNPPGYSPITPSEGRLGNAGLSFEPAQRTPG